MEEKREKILSDLKKNSNDKSVDDIVNAVQSNIQLFNSILIAIPDLDKDLKTFISEDEALKKAFQDLINAINDSQAPKNWSDKIKGKKEFPSLSQIY